MIQPLPDFSTVPDADSFSMSNIAHASDVFNLLSCAMDLKIFELLKTKKTSEELSEEIKTDPRLTNKILKALVSENLLSYSDGIYSLNYNSQTYLIQDSPFYQGNLLELYNNTRKNRWDTLYQVLKGEKISQQKDIKGVFSPSFVLAMAEGAVNGQIQAALSALTNEECMNNAKTLLDIGGGHGLYGIAFTQKYPALSATIMDLPPVISEVTIPFIATYNTNRVFTIAGDYEKDDLKGPYDIIFASDTLYRPKEEIIRLLKRFSDYLSPDGIIISKHWQIEDLVQDKTAVWFDLMLSLNSTEDRVHDSKTFQSCIKEADLQVVKQIPLNHAAKPTVITIMRRTQA